MTTTVGFTDGDPDLYAYAQRRLTYRQFDAWRLVAWEGNGKRHAARILGIHITSLQARLDGAEVKLHGVVRPVRLHSRRGSV